MNVKKIAVSAQMAVVRIRMEVIYVFVQQDIWLIEKEQAVWVCSIILKVINLNVDLTPDRLV